MSDFRLFIILSFITSIIAIFAFKITKTPIVMNNVNNIDKKKNPPNINYSVNFFLNIDNNNGIEVKYKITKNDSQENTKEVSVFSFNKKVISNTRKIFNKFSFFYILFPKASIKPKFTVTPKKRYHIISMNKKYPQYSYKNRLKSILYLKYRNFSNIYWKQNYDSLNIDIPTLYFRKTNNNTYELSPKSKQSLKNKFAKRYGDLFTRLSQKIMLKNGPNIIKVKAFSYKLSNNFYSISKN